MKTFHHRGTEARRTGNWVLGTGYWRSLWFALGIWVVRVIFRRHTRPLRGEEMLARLREFGGL